MISRTYHDNNVVFAVGVLVAGPLRVLNTNGLRFDQHNASQDRVLNVCPTGSRYSRSNSFEKSLDHGQQ